MKALIRLMLLIALVLPVYVANAQFNIGERVQDKVNDRINNKIDNGIDKGLDEVEGGLKGDKKKNVEEQEDQESENADENSSSEPDEDTQKPKSGKQDQPSLQSYSKYDFVPGDKVLYFEDFSQDAIGDFPALWTSNSSGEVKTVNIAPGKWFHLNGEDAAYCYTKSIKFPENFIIEFDIIPDDEYRDGITLTFYEENPEESKEMNDDLFPGVEGLHINLKSDGWETKGYRNEDNTDMTGQSVKNPVVKEQVNHVIVWIQKRRVRIYHQGAKTLDMPTNIFEGTVFNRMRFGGWDARSWPMVSNIKITTASPDTRSKLITEGKLVTYGITFDVNKADIKSESYGTLNSIAEVLKANPDVRIKIVGHTDSDGADAANLDLSKRRATSVKNELVKAFGINASRLESDGKGESQPLAPNDTPLNKALNRRVEFLKL